MGRIMNKFLMLVILLAKESLPLIAENEDVSGRISMLRSDETSTDDKTAIAAKGETVVLQCDFRVTGWFTVQWLKFQGGEESTDEVPIALTGSVTSNNGSLSSATLETIDENDEGNYSCVLSSLASGSKTYNFLLVVKDERSCESSTCTPNGYCSELENGYNCTCKAGFIGSNCEFEDPCLDSPCQHNGKCVANGEEFSCRCVRGYGGTVCDSEVCTPNICGSGGTCRVKDKRVTCQCPHNKAGNRCQNRCRFNTLYRVYCYNGHNKKTCKISNYYGENCVCDENRRSGGNRCMMESDERNECNDPDICNGRGTCYNQVFSYRCECNSYASGTNCEFLNECRRSNLCSTYGGTCVDLVNGYKCTNCPDGQHGDKCQYKKNPCKVTCYGSSMRAECDLRFLSNKMKTIPMYLNEKVESCRLRSTYGTMRRITVYYTSCGTEIEYGENHVIYRNNLRVGNSEKVDNNAFDSIITRAVGHFTFKMECILPLARNVTANLKDMSLLSNETMDLQDRKNIGVTGTHIQFYSGNYSRQITQYIVGDRLFVKMTINEDNNPTLSHGYKLHPVTCFASPDRQGNNERYILLEDGCVVDKTFRFENDSDSDSPQREAFFSFDSFSFKSNAGQLYLHCTSLACDFPTAESTNREDCDVTCKNTDPSREIPTTTSAHVATVAAHDKIDRASGASVDIFSTKPV